MIREVPTLYETILKIIARHPAKCMTKSACEKLMTAIESGCFQERDIIQIVLNQIIDAGRMTDDAVPLLIFKDRREVSLSNSKISGKYLVGATSLCEENLVKLDVSGCFQVNNHHVVSVLEQCPNIYRLNIRNCRKITDELLENIVTSNYNNLTEFDFGGNFNITDDGVRKFIDNYSSAAQITSLSISGLQISDETILLIAKKCKSLTSLGCGYLDLRETTIQTLMTKLGSQLEFFDWSWPSTAPVVRNVQPSAVFIVDTLTTLCPSLREVDLTGNRNLTLPNIIELIERKLTSSTTDTKKLEVLRIKFIATPKSQLEANLLSTYTHLKLVL